MALDPQDNSTYVLTTVEHRRTYQLRSERLEAHSVEQAIRKASWFFEGLTVPGDWRRDAFYAGDRIMRYFGECSMCAGPGPSTAVGFEQTGERCCTGCTRALTDGAGNPIIHLVDGFPQLIDDPTQPT